MRCVGHNRLAAFAIEINLADIILERIGPKQTSVAAEEFIKF